MFHVTNKGVASRLFLFAAEAPEAEVAELIELAGVAAPEDALEASREEVEEAELAARSPESRFSRREIAAGRGAVDCSACGIPAPPSASCGSSLLLSASCLVAGDDCWLMWYSSHDSSTCVRLRGCRFSNLAARVSKQKAQWACVAIMWSEVRCSQCWMEVARSLVAFGPVDVRAEWTYGEAMRLLLESVASYSSLDHEHGITTVKRVHEVVMTERELEVLEMYKISRTDDVQL